MGCYLRTVDPHTDSKNNQPTQGSPAWPSVRMGNQSSLVDWTGSLRFWIFESGEIIRTMTGHNNMILSLVFSPDGKHLGSASWDGTAKVWNLTSGIEISTFTGHPEGSLVDGIAFSSDGKQVYTSGTDVHKWDAESGKELFVFPWEEKEALWSRY